MEILGFTSAGSLVDCLFTVINVLILVVCVRIFLWKPVKRILKARQDEVDESLNSAAQAQAQAEALLNERTASMADLERETADTMADARKKAKAEGDRILDAAQDRADAILHQAEVDAQAEKEKILRQAQSEITEIIVAAAAKTVGVSAEDLAEGSDELYDEFLKKAGSADE